MRVYGREGTREWGNEGLRESVKRGRVKHIMGSPAREVQWNLREAGTEQSRGVADTQSACSSAVLPAMSTHSITV